MVVQLMVGIVSLECNYAPVQRVQEKAVQLMATIVSFLRSHPGPQSGPTLALGGVESAKTLHNHFLTEMCGSRGQHKGGLVFLSSTLAPCLLTSCCRKGK